ncbi:glycoside hydrolase family 68 protein [Microbacterium dextranolyticum]|uniref:Glycoside hydrolase 68 family protein n=1 Tax=Microbacterium dextranolyticum TaxID=36806 RepID=A0A9W6M5C0_9MICO|nr:glycoside hydrolase family 68 protein [Microbacterium dextranolyticum]MBM7464210.1 levansucrase [Microbacterium dextranolyticum]GLJ95204.1 glycoside hydrolase 68 family protein [Microbacterium dextranolyticum]
MTTTTRAPRRRLRRAAAIIAATAAAATLLAASPASAAVEPVPVPGFPAPTAHSQQAYDPTDDFTAKWTRADARQIAAMSDPTAPSRENSLPEEYTMPTVPKDFPDMSNDQVWVWDSWTLTDGTSNQPSFKGWEVVFSLVADRSLGFDDRHTYARLGYFYRKANVAERPANGGWTYGGHVFPDGASGAIFEDQSFSHQTEWSGSTRIFDGNKLRIFYTAVAFYRNEDGSNRKPYDPRIVQSEGRIFADENGVWMTGFRDQHDMLQADGTYYQNGAQNEFFNFRDPFTFEDPAHPGKTYMVFEGNTAAPRGERVCTAADMGYRAGDPYTETADEVMDRGAHYQLANVGLAVADNAALTEWTFLPPILSANCVNDQTERPQIYMKDGKYYLFTISHRGTYAAGIDGPEGVYGFVGDGIRSDFQPVNRGSGLALGSPSNLNFAAGKPFAPDYNQHPGQFQAYSHYVMPGGLVQSFIDTIGTSDDFVRGGTLAPTVKLDIDGSDVTVDRSYGHDGLGQWADIPSNYSHPISSASDPRPTR